MKNKDIIELDAEDLIKDMGFIGRQPRSVLNGLRYILAPEGIKVRYHSHKTHAAWDQIFIFEKVSKLDNLNNEMILPPKK